jgi:Kef-type K+ transport system membrane component KefB
MQHTEDILFSTLLQLIVIVLAARGANQLARRLGQPGAVGEIIAGLLLGPSLLGYALPDVSHFLFSPTASMPISILSQIGLILLMFQIGSDFEFAHLGNARNRRTAIAIAVVSIAAPLALGLLIGMISAPILAPHIDIFTYSLFIGVALAITAVPILGRILREFDLTRTEVGVITIAAAAVNDVVGWLLLAGTAAYAAAHFSGERSFLQVSGVIALVAVLWFAARARHCAPAPPAISAPRNSAGFLFCDSGSARPNSSSPADLRAARSETIAASDAWVCHGRRNQSGFPPEPGRRLSRPLSCGRSH